MDTALFKEAEKCGMEIQEPHEDASCTYVRKGCCKEEQLFVDGQDQLKLDLPELSQEQFSFLYYFISSYAISLNGFAIEKPNYQGHSPPILSRPLFILYERYLI